MTTIDSTDVRALEVLADQLQERGDLRGEFMVLLVAALVILGPERLPGAVTWVTKTMRQVKEYASGASQQLKDELGPEFDVRDLNPRTFVQKHLLEGVDQDDLNAQDKPVSATPTATQSLAAGERPPYDPEST